MIKPFKAREVAFDEGIPFDSEGQLSGPSKRRTKLTGEAWAAVPVDQVKVTSERDQCDIEDQVYVARVVESIL